MSGWKATAAAINALPDEVREWVAELETRCEPAGDLRARRMAEDEARGLRLEIERLRAECQRISTDYNPDPGQEALALSEMREAIAALAGEVDTSVPGQCCDCGYRGEEETPCPLREDLTHCEHWWDGPDTPDIDAAPSGRERNVTP